MIEVVDFEALKQTKLCTTGKNKKNLDFKISFNMTGVRDQTKSECRKEIWRCSSCKMIEYDFVKLVYVNTKNHTPTWIPWESLINGRLKQLSMGMSLKLQVLTCINVFPCINTYRIPHPHNVRILSTFVPVSGVTKGLRTPGMGPFSCEATAMTARLQQTVEV